MPPAAAPGQLVLLYFGLACRKTASPKFAIARQQEILVKFTAQAIG
jgi:hypothetical protein